MSEEKKVPPKRKATALASCEETKDVVGQRKYCDIHRFNALMKDTRGKLPARLVPPRDGPKRFSSNSLKEFFPTPMNQEAEGSCTGFALSHYIKALDPTQDPSPQFIYTMELLKENPGQPIRDVGANVADGCQIARDTGVCPMKDFPYPVDPKTHKVLNFGQIPNAKAMADAAAHKLPYDATDVTFNGISKLETIEQLIDEDTPVLLAFIVYASFEGAQNANNGIMPMPTAAEAAGAPLGGHQIVVTGYKPGYLECINSWGTKWGQAGYFDMPNDFLTAGGAFGPFVQQLIAIAPLPLASPPDPLPVPPGPPGPIPPGAIGQIRAEVACVQDELAHIDELLVALPQ